MSRFQMANIRYSTQIWMNFLEIKSVPCPRNTGYVKGGVTVSWSSARMVQTTWFKQKATKSVYSCFPYIVCFTSLTFDELFQTVAFFFLLSKISNAAEDHIWHGVSNRGGSTAATFRARRCGGGFFLAREEFGRMFNHSFPACAFLFLSFLNGN